MLLLFTIKKTKRTDLFSLLFSFFTHSLAGELQRTGMSKIPVLKEEQRTISSLYNRFLSNVNKLGINY